MERWLPWTSTPNTICLIRFFCKFFSSRPCRSLTGSKHSRIYIIGGFFFLFSCMHTNYLNAKSNDRCVSDTCLRRMPGQIGLLLEVGFSFTQPLDNQMRIIVPDLNYEPANSPQCARGLSVQPYTRCAALLHWLLICAREISLCVKGLYDGSKITAVEKELFVIMVGKWYNNKNCFVVFFNSFNSTFMCCIQGWKEAAMEEMWRLAVCQNTHW